MDLKELGLAVQQIAAEKGITPEAVIGAIELALAAAYKKEYRKRSEVVRGTFDPKTGSMRFVLVKTVVDPAAVRVVEEGDEEPPPPAGGPASPQRTRGDSYEEELGEGELPRYNPDRHIFLEEARGFSSTTAVGDEMTFPLETHADFGRIAAQTAKQVVLQHIREAERHSVQEEFADKEGQIVSGIVQRFERGNVYVDLGRAVGLMFRNESIPGERYRIGERLRFLVLAVQDDPRRPGIILSRAHPTFLSKLFELEVPEIAEGTVVIKQIAREAGSRSKVAVHSSVDGVDPVGAAVGQRGTRVMAVTNELGLEKVDIIEWSDDIARYLGNALSPARVRAVETYDRREARVLVPEDQLSLAIGKGGQNVRLAAKLTGWRIDVRSQADPETEQESGVGEAPVLPHDTETPPAV